MKQKSPLLLLFFFSGVSGLIYQISWIRWSSLLFGSSVAALAAVTAVYFGGLAVGNWLIVRKAHRFGMSFFAKLEVLTALAAVMSIPLFHLAEMFPFSGSLLVSLLLLVMCIAPAAILIGMGLPVMVGLTHADTNTVGRNVGLIYCVHTLGAVVGGLVTGFVLIPELGIMRSIVLAAVIECILAFFARFLMSPATSSREEQKKNPVFSLLPVCIFFCVGFSCMAAEMIWGRFLNILVHNTVYSYSVTIAVVVAGLATGAGLGSLFSDRIKFPGALVGIIAVCMGTYIWGTLFLPVEFWAGLVSNETPFSLLRVAMLLMFIPSVLSGSFLPLIVHLLTNKSAYRSEAVGILSSANTFGGILGSLVGGFVLLPFFGIVPSVMVVSTILLTVGLVSLLIFPGSPYRFAVLLIPALVLPLSSKNSVNLIPQYFSGNGQLLAIEEGREAIVSVHKRNDVKVMEINRLWQGENRKTRQIMAAHLPMLLAPTLPKEVLVIGMGTGVTAERFLQYEVDSLHCIDIEPAVFDLAKQEFGATWLDSAGVRAISEDGRSVVRHSREKYDLISIEIGQIFRPHSAGFYTEDFYRTAKRALTATGVISQFVPVASFDPEMFKSVIRTFMRVFPQSQLWYNGSEFLLIGYMEKVGTLDNTTTEAYLQPGTEVFADLQWSYWGATLYPLMDLRILAGNYLCGPDALERLVGDGPVFNDDKPNLEYYAARNQSHEPFIESLEPYLSDPQDILSVAKDPKDNQAIRQIRDTNLGDIIASELLLEYWRQAHPVPGILEKALEYNPLNVMVLQELGNLLYEQKKYPEAREMLERASRMDRGNASLFRRIALVKIQQNEIDGAIHDLLTALEMDPNDYVAHTTLAAVMLQNQRYELAKRHVTAALQVQPRYPEALRMKQYLDERSLLEEPAK